MRSNLIIRVFLSFVLTLLVSCEGEEKKKDPEEGKIFDSPISVVSDGTYLYVANANFNLSRDGDGFLAIVDPKKLIDGENPIVKKVKLAPLCGHIELDSENKILYLADRRNDRVTLLSIEDPENPIVGDSIDVAPEPYALFLDSDANRLFVGTLSGYLSVVDLARSGVITNFLLASKLSSIALGPERSYLAAISRTMNVVYIFDPDELEFLFSFEVGGQGLISSARALAVSPDGKWFYVAVKSPELVAVYQNERMPWYWDRALYAFVPLDCTPEELLSVDDYLIVLCKDDDRLIAVDSQVFYPVAEVETCDSPVSLTALPDPRDSTKKLIAITCFDSHELELIDTVDWEVVAKR